MIWKRTELISDALAGILFMFGGLLLALEQLPDWLASVARLVPVTHAAESMRIVLLDGDSPFVFGGDGGLAWLLGTAGAWVFAGVLVFRFGEVFAKKHGSLSRY